MQAPPVDEFSPLTDEHKLESPRPSRLKAWWDREGYFRAFINGCSAWWNGPHFWQKKADEAHQPLTQNDNKSDTPSDVKKSADSAAFSPWNQHFAIAFFILGLMLIVAPFLPIDALKLLKLTWVPAYAPLLALSGFLLSNVSFFFHRLHVALRTAKTPDELGNKWTSLTLKERTAAGVVIFLGVSAILFAALAPFSVFGPAAAHFVSGHFLGTSVSTIFIASGAAFAGFASIVHFLRVLKARASDLLSTSEDFQHFGYDRAALEQRAHKNPRWSSYIAAPWVQLKVRAIVFWRAFAEQRKHVSWKVAGPAVFFAVIVPAVVLPIGATVFHPSFLSVIAGPIGVGNFTVLLTLVIALSIGTMMTYLTHVLKKPASAKPLLLPITDNNAEPAEAKEHKLDAKAIQAVEKKTGEVLQGMIKKKMPYVFDAVQQNSGVGGNTTAQHIAILNNVLQQAQEQEHPVLSEERKLVVRRVAEIKRRAEEVGGIGILNKIALSGIEKTFFVEQISAIQALQALEALPQRASAAQVNARAIEMQKLLPVACQNQQMPSQDKERAKLDELAKIEADLDKKLKKAGKDPLLLVEDEDEDDAKLSLEDQQAIDAMDETERLLGEFLRPPVRARAANFQTLQDPEDEAEVDEPTLFSFYERDNVREVALAQRRAVIAQLEATMGSLGELHQKVAGYPDTLQRYQEANHKGKVVALEALQTATQALIDAKQALIDRLSAQVQGMHGADVSGLLAPAIAQQVNALAKKAAPLLQAIASEEEKVGHAKEVMLLARTAQADVDRRAQQQRAKQQAQQQEQLRREQEAKQAEQQQKQAEQQAKQQAEQLQKQQAEERRREEERQQAAEKAKQQQLAAEQQTKAEEQQRQQAEQQAEQKEKANAKAAQEQAERAERDKASANAAHKVGLHATPPPSPLHSPRAGADGQNVDNVLQEVVNI